jgi:hypothetical protein
VAPERNKHYVTGGLFGERHCIHEALNEGDDRDTVSGIVFSVLSALMEMDESLRPQTAEGWAAWTRGFTEALLYHEHEDTEE